MRLRAVAAATLAFGLTGCATGASAPPQSRAYADLLVARAARLSHDYAASADRYAAAFARSPGEPALAAAVVTARLASGDALGARRFAARAGDEPFARLVRASDALTDARWQAAAEEANAVEGAAADELLARVMLTWARAAQARFDEVSLDPAALVHVRPYGGLFAYQQAMALDYAGQTEEALAAYDIANASGLWLPAAIERHADLLARSGARDRAATLLSDERNRTNPALALALARLEARGRPAQGEITPRAGGAIVAYGLALIFLQEGDSERGLATATLATMLDPELDAAWVTFAQEQARLGHLQAAREALARARAGSPYHASARSLDALFVFQAGDRETGLALARANAEGGDTIAVRNYADMLRSAGRHDEAEPLYGRLLADDRDSWRLYFSRGVARERLGRWAEAQADFQEALRLSPDQPDTLNYLGYMWVDRGERIEEGLALITRALALRPQSGAIVDSLGWAYYRQGDYERAIDLLERATELEAGDATITDHLGDAYWRVGRRVEARYQWRRALALAPDDPQAIEAKIEAGLAEAPP